MKSILGRSSRFPTFEENTLSSSLSKNSIFHSDPTEKKLSVSSATDNIRVYYSHFSGLEVLDPLTFPKY
jgi:hypothetical protein